MSDYQAPKHGFRTFFIIWATQSVSVIGTALTVFALNIFVATKLYGAPDQKAQLAGAITLLNLAHIIPVVIMAPLAGAFADRHNRKQIMFWCDIISGIVSAATVLMLLAGHAALWSLVLVSGAYGVMDAFHGAAFDTAYAMLVTDQELNRANAMMQTTNAISTIIAPALAAFLIGLPAIALRAAWGGAIGHALAAMSDGTALAIAIDCATFFLAAAVLPFLSVPSPVRTDLQQGRSMWADIKEGAVYIGRRRPMLWMMVILAVINLMMPLGVLLPLLVKFDLGADLSVRHLSFEYGLALLTTAESAGAVLAGVLVMVWGGLKRRRILGGLVPLVVCGVGEALLGWSPWLYLSTAMMFLIGLAVPVCNIHLRTIWQAQVPRELQGRVLSVRRVVSQSAVPVGVSVAGWLAGRYDPGAVMTVISVLMAGFCFLQLFNPILLKVEDKAYLDQLAVAANQ